MSFIRFDESSCLYLANSATSFLYFKVKMISVCLFTSVVCRLDHSRGVNYTNISVLRNAPKMFRTLIDGNSNFLVMGFFDKGGKCLLFGLSHPSVSLSLFLFLSWTFLQRSRYQYKNGPCHTNGALRVILMKMFIFSMYIILRYIYEILRRKSFKISFLWDR